MTLTLHEHPFAAYCWKPLIALDELGLPHRRALVEDDAARARLAELWPLASIPVLVDDEAGLTLPESTAIVEYLDALAPLRASSRRIRRAALQARLWDRIVDGHVMTPMQKIVGDSLRPLHAARCPWRRRGARGAAARLCACSMRSSPPATGSRAPTSRWPTAPLRRRSTMRASWSAGTRRAWRTSRAPSARSRRGPRSPRVIDGARIWRSVFPLPWPAYAE